MVNSMFKSTVVVKSMIESIVELLWTTYKLHHLFSVQPKIVDWIVCVSNRQTYSKSSPDQAQS